MCALINVHNTNWLTDWLICCVWACDFRRWQWYVIVWYIWHQRSQHFHFDGHKWSLCVCVCAREATKNIIPIQMNTRIVVDNKPIELLLVGIVTCIVEYSTEVKWIVELNHLPKPHYYIAHNVLTQHTAAVCTKSTRAAVSLVCRYEFTK